MRVSKYEMCKSLWDDKKAILRERVARLITLSFCQRIPSSERFMSSSVVSYLPRQIILLCYLFNASLSSGHIEFLSSSEKLTRLILRNYLDR